MSSKIVYSLVAVVGIAAASGAAWWYQSRPQGPQEMTGPGAAGAARGASGAQAGAPGAPGALRATGVEVAKIERTSLQDDAQAVGSLRSKQAVVVRPEVAGRVLELGFTDGGRVRKGQLLAQLDDVLQRAEVKQSQAQVGIAKANYTRNQELVAQNFVAQRVLDESLANLAVTEAQLSLSCARLVRMRIEAPFDGTVGIRTVNVGDYVKDGADLINLEDISAMFVDFRLPERYQTKVKLGQTVELQLEAFPGRMFKAKVQAIDPTLDANGRSVAVRAVLPNTGGEPLVSRGAGRPGGAGAPGAPSGAASGAVGKAAQPKPGLPVAARRAPPLAGAPAERGAAVSEEARACLAHTLKGGAPSGVAAGLDTAKARAIGPTKTATGAPPAGGRNADGGGGGGPGPLRPGMFARVTAVFAVKDNALVVPEEAIVPQGGRQFVFRVVDRSEVPGTTTAALPAEFQEVSLRTEVRLGVRRGGKVEVEGANTQLAEGARVVIAGQQRLQRDGTPVRVAEIGRPPAGAGGGAAAAAQSGSSGVVGSAMAPAGAMGGASGPAAAAAASAASGR